jgi:hypothetical protein
LPRASRAALGAGAEPDRGSLGESSPQALSGAPIVAPATPATARRSKERRPSIVDISFGSVSLRGMAR